MQPLGEAGRNSGAGRGIEAGHSNDDAQNEDADSVLIDSHCHPHFPPLGADPAAVVAEMDAQQVAAALAVATTQQEWTTVCQLAAHYPARFFAALGIHPTTDEPLDEDALHTAAQNPAVLAIGETGLDFYRNTVDEAQQRRQFAAHIRVARAVKKPLIIHTRDSLDAVLDVLQKENAQDIGGVLHCWTGDAQGVAAAVAINFCVSFTGIVSFKNAEVLRAVVRTTPADAYMVETDAPYLAPVPQRGKTNTPGYVRYVAQAVAAARNTTTAQVAAETTATFHRLFTPPQR